MKKKILVGILAGAMTATMLVGCGNNAKTEQNGSAPSSASEATENTQSTESSDSSDASQGDGFRAFLEGKKIGALAYIGTHYDRGEEPEEIKEAMQADREAVEERMSEEEKAEMEARRAEREKRREEREKEGKERPKPDITYYDTLNALTLALGSGDIDYMRVPQCVADYMSKQSSEFEIVEMPRRNEAETESENSSDDSSTRELRRRFTNFSLLVMEDQKDLLDELDKAIISLYEDGTIESLKSDYIDNLSSEPKAVDIEKSDSDRKLTVAVTGDLPPMDFVDAAGNPAGFNTALIAALSKKIDANFDIITIDSGARATALSSGKADIVFWASSRNYDHYNPFTDGVDAEKLAFMNDKSYFGEDVAEGTTVSIPYFIDSYVFVQQKQ